MQTSLEESEPGSSSGVKEGFEKPSDLVQSDSDSECQEEEEEEDDDDFTFVCVADDDSSFPAEDLFDNGKIRPVFPLFDQSLVYTSDFPQHPPVKNIFVESSGNQHRPSLTTAGADDGSGQTDGPNCPWSGKTVEVVGPAASPNRCKKSNSTGFSKIWRFKEMTNRSNSDGRDAFVFLNKPTPEKKMTEKKTKEQALVASSAKKKGGGKGKTVASAHEVYVKSKAASSEGDRRRSYLPYKPELVGFFTNVHGGMSKNVHPF